MQKLSEADRAMEPSSISRLPDLRKVLLPEAPTSDRNWLRSTELSRDGLYLSQILDKPKIFISSANSAWQQELLEQHNIKAVLSIVPQIFEDIEYPTPNAESIEKYRIVSKSPSINPVYQELNIARYFVPFENNGGNTPDKLIAAFEVLRELSKEHLSEGILIHCSTGISRSVALVGALIAKYQKCSFESAVKIIAQFRDINIHEDLAISFASALDISLDETPNT